MALNLDTFAVLDLVGGLLLAATGVFVLIHAPRRDLRALFFAFAGADAAATILFRVSELAIADDWRIAARGAYWWFQIAALGALAAFGAVFPRPVRSPRFARALGLAVGGLTIVALAAYVVDRAAFWTPVRAPDGALSYATGPAGFLVQVGLAAIVTWLLLRAVVLMRAAPVSSRADQAAFVFGGVCLTYAGIPGALLALRAKAGDAFSGSLPRTLSSASFAIALAATLVAAILAARLRGRARNVVLGSALATLLVVVATWMEVASLITIQTIAVCVGPILLAYAILRYAVFDVDLRVRRAVTLTLGGAGVGGVFIVAEGLLQGYLQDNFLSGFTSGVVATAIAGILAAALMLPIARLAGILGKRIVPVREADSQHLRKLEIYRHAVEGAREGGIDERESFVLARLRESLGITDSEHQAILAGSAPA